MRVRGVEGGWRRSLDGPWVFSCRSRARGGVGVLRARDREIFYFFGMISVTGACALRALLAWSVALGCVGPRQILERRGDLVGCGIEFSRGIEFLLAKLRSVVVEPGAVVGRIEEGDGDREESGAKDAPDAFVPEVGRQQALRSSCVRGDGEQEVAIVEDVPTVTSVGQVFRSPDELNRSFKYIMFQPSLQLDTYFDARSIKRRGKAIPRSSNPHLGWTSISTPRSLRPVSAESSRQSSRNHTRSDF